MHNKQRIALLKACRIVGGQKQLAEMIHVGQSRLNKWINRNKKHIPYWYAIDIERVTQGQVTCEELVPEWEEIKVHYHKNIEHYLKQNERNVIGSNAVAN
jgi:DNA-binding transcriptional regulator YdaS (Cro superfamily)